MLASAGERVERRIVAQKYVSHVVSEGFNVSRFNRTTLIACLEHTVYNIRSDTRCSGCVGTCDRKDCVPALVLRARMLHRAGAGRRALGPGGVGMLAGSHPIDAWYDLPGSPQIPLLCE